MKSIRDNLFGMVMVYKTSYELNPVLTVLSTVIVAAFTYSIGRIFGL